jgi:hypothetical protein
MHHTPSTDTSSTQAASSAAGPAADLSSAALRIVAVDPRGDPAWNAYAASHPDALPFHHSGWIAALRDEYRQEVVGLACVDARGRWRGILPLVCTRGLPLGLGGRLGARRLASLPRTPLAGPLASDDDALEALVAAAVAWVDAHPGTLLQLKTAGTLPARAAQRLHAEPWRQSYVIGLGPDPDALRFGASRQHGRITWAVRKAAKEGVVVRAAERPEELRAWYRLYLDTMRWHMVPPRPYRLFAALWRHLHPLGHMTLLLAERGDDLLAGSLYLDFGATRFYAFNGRRRDALHLRPNDALQWHAIRQACLDGRTAFDLGEVVEGHVGLADFKAKWGARATRLVRYTYPGTTGTAPAEEASDRDSKAEAAADDAPQPVGWIHAAWRHVPLPATALVGRAVYAFL